MDTKHNLYLPKEYLENLSQDTQNQFRKYFSIDSNGNRNSYDISIIIPKSYVITLKDAKMMEKSRITNYIICQPLANKTELVYYLTKEKLSTDWIRSSIHSSHQHQEVITFVWFNKDQLYVTSLFKIQNQSIYHYIKNTFSTLHRVFKSGNFRYPKKNYLGSYQIYRWLFDRQGSLVDIHPLSISYITNLEFILYKWVQMSSLTFKQFKKYIKPTFPEVNLIDTKKMPDSKKIKYQKLYHSATTEIPYIQHFIDKALKRLGYIKVQKEDSFIGESIPGNESLSLVYGTITKLPNMDYSKHTVDSIINSRSLIENNSPFITVMSKKITDFLSNKKIFFDSIQKTHPDRVRSNYNLDRMPFHRILYTFSFDVGDFGKKLSDPNKIKSLTHMFRGEFKNHPDMAWIFKPANGSQGKGIFIQTSLRKNSIHRMIRNVLQQLKNQCLHYHKKELRNYKEWICCQFIDNPLCFDPFRNSTHFTQHLKNMGIDKTSCGHKSHLRFYMAIKQNKFDQKISYYVHPEPMIFLAAMPYDYCNQCFSKDKFSMNETQYCNQSNLSKNSEYFKLHKIKSNPYKLFSCYADDAFSAKFSHIKKSQFYQTFILPQIIDIAHIVKESVESFEVPIRCQNMKLDETCPSCYKGCLQYLAIDVLFDDGEFTHGIPHAWLLEVNTRPGMMGIINTENISKSSPDRQKKMEDLFYNIYRGVDHSYDEHYDQHWVRQMILQAEKEIGSIK